MFSKLVKDKKNIISCIITLLVSLSVTSIGATPFGYAMIGSLIENNIPILFPFIVVILVTGIMFGKVSLWRVFIATIIYAILKGILNKRKEDSKIKTSSIFIMSYTLSSLALVFFKMEDFEMMLPHIFESFISTIFMFVFAKALGKIINFGKEKSLKKEDFLCLAIIILIGLSVFNYFSFNVSGVTVYSLISIVLLMILCYKKKVSTSVLYSIIICLVFFLITGNFIFKYMLLYVLVGAVTALLSLTGKIGLIIGFIFTSIYLLFLAPSKEMIMNQLGVNGAVINDYNNFVKRQSGDKYKLAEIPEMVEKMVDTPTTIVFREMMIGFLILCLVPQAILNKYEELINLDDKSKALSIIRKLYRPKVLLLNPGKINKEEKKPNNKDDKAKKNKNTKSNKKSKKKKAS